MEFIDGYKLMSILRHTLNKLDYRLIDHGYRVAYMAWKCALFEGNLQPEELRDFTITSFLHDIGAYKTDDIEKMVEFETQDIMKHSVYGYLFLKYLAPLKDYSRAILCHHMPYNKLKNYNIPEWKYIQILFICDRFDILMTIYNDVQEAKNKLLEHSETLFSLDMLDLFFQADVEHHFIEDVYLKDIELDFSEISKILHSDEELRAYLDMITYSIDFRSEYMITHTMTTNRIALHIGKLMQVSTSELEKIDLGSIFHDLGKIGIPSEILDFPGKLDDEQMIIMRKHVDYTIEILDHLIEEDIVQIAVRHHEKLNGTGYPLGLNENDLTMNERIVAVADIVSALYEQRSYKAALQKHEIVKILRSNVNHHELDSTIVETTIAHYDEIIAQVQKECDPMILLYSKLSKLYPEICQNMEEYLIKGTSLT
ncbi:MAG: HD domain-containing protein [Longicatena sp.]